MSFEIDPETHVERQVDAIFEDTSGKTVKERMGIAAFDLLGVISEERQATSEVLRSYLERGKDTRTQRPTFGTVIINGFMGVGIGFVGGYVPTPEGNPQKDDTQQLPDELSGKFTRLEEAKLRLGEAKELLADIYELKPRHIKKAEAIARRLQ